MTPPPLKIIAKRTNWSHSQPHKQRKPYIHSGVKLCLFTPSARKSNLYKLTTVLELKGSMVVSREGFWTSQLALETVQKYPEGFVQNGYGVNKMEVVTAATSRTWCLESQVVLRASWRQTRTDTPETLTGDFVGALWEPREGFRRGDAVARRRYCCRVIWI